VDESAFDRYGIDNMLSDQHAVKLLGHPNRILQGGSRMLRAIERNQNIFEHGLLQSAAQPERDAIIAPAACRAAIPGLA
jgi:hypothetical protein